MKMVDAICNTFLFEVLLFLNKLKRFRFSYNLLKTFESNAFLKSKFDKNLQFSQREVNGQREVDDLGCLPEVQSIHILLVNKY